MLLIIPNNLSTLLQLQLSGVIIQETIVLNSTGHNQQMLLESYSQSHRNKTDQSVFTKQSYFIQLWSNSSHESDDDFQLDYQRFINRNGC